MVLLASFGYLMCNVLLAWAALTTLSSPLPQNKNKWVHLVIFEPQPKIQLTRSSYKVTSFLDFQPFLRGFQSVNEYLKDLTRDINNPDTIFKELNHHSAISRLHPYLMNQ